MKLIDADKVIEQEKYYAKKYKGDFGEQVSWHTIEILDSAPTVDAIPIEWIQRYYANHPFNFVSGMLYDWAMEQAEMENDKAD